MTEPLPLADHPPAQLPDPDTLGRAEIAAMNALIDSGLGRQILGDGNTMAAVVHTVVAAAAPILLTAQPPSDPADEVKCPNCGHTIRARMSDAPCNQACGKPADQTCAQWGCPGD